MGTKGEGKLKTEPPSKVASNVRDKKDKFTLRNLQKTRVEQDLPPPERQDQIYKKEWNKRKENLERRERNGARESIEMILSYMGEISYNWEAQLKLKEIERMTRLAKSSKLQGTVT